MNHLRKISAMLTNPFPSLAKTRKSLIESCRQFHFFCRWQRQITWLFVLAFVGFLLQSQRTMAGVPAPVTGPQQCGAALVQSSTTAATRHLTYYSPFVPDSAHPSTNRIMYRNRRFETTIDIKYTNSAPANPLSLAEHYHLVTWSPSRWTNNFGEFINVALEEAVSTNWGSFSQDQSRSGHCETVYTNGIGWDNPDCVNNSSCADLIANPYPLCGTWIPSSPELATLDCQWDDPSQYGGVLTHFHMVGTMTTNSTTITITGSGNVGVTSYSLTQTTVETLSWEMNVRDLIAQVRSDLSLQSYGPYSDTPGYASLKVSDDETYVDATGYRYRIRLPQTDPRLEYDVKMKELIHLPNGSVAVRKKHELIAGTGTVAYGHDHYARLPQASPGKNNTEFVTVSVVGVTVLPKMPGLPGTMAGAGAGGGGIGGSWLGGGGCSSCGGAGQNMFTGEDGLAASSGGLAFSLRAGSSGGGWNGMGLHLSISSLDNGTVEPEDYDGDFNDGLYPDFPSNDGIGVERALQGPLDGFGFRHKGVTNLISSITSITVSNEWGWDTNYNILPPALFQKMTGRQVIRYFVPGASLPFVTWTVNPPASGAVLVTRTLVDGSIDNYSYSIAVPNTIRLTINDQRVERHVWDSNYDDSNQRSEVSTIEDTNGAILYQVTRVYQQFPTWNPYNSPELGLTEALVTETVGAGPNALTTRYIYDSTGPARGSFLPLIETIHPDGSWEYYQYLTYNADAVEVVTDIYSGLGDTAPPAPVPDAPPSAANCRHVEYSYASVDTLGTGADGGGMQPDTAEPYTPRTVTEYWRGHPISKRFVIIRSQQRIEYECEDPNSTGPDDTRGRLFITTTQLDASHRPTSITHPDGTITTYTYGVTGPEPVTESHGAPGTGGTVSDGTRTTTVRNAADELQSLTTIDILSGQTIASETYSNPDSFLRYRTATFLDGTSESRTFDCCGLSTWTDRDGVTTSYGYDGLHRVNAVSRLGITILSTLDAAGNTLALTRVAGTNTTTLQSTAYDLGGRITDTYNALGGHTAIADVITGGRRVVTTTLPDLGTRIETYYLDGSLKTLTGTAVFPVKYTSDVALLDGLYRQYTITTNLDSSFAGTPERVQRFQDALGRPYKTIYPDASFSQSFYNDSGKLSGLRDADNVMTLFDYNARGEQEYTTTDVGDATHARNSQRDPTGIDRIRRVVSDVYNHPTHGWVRRSRSYVWNQLGVDNALLTADLETSLDGLHSWSTSFGRTVETLTVFGTGGARTQTTIAPDLSRTISQYQNGRLVSVTRQDSGGNPIGQLTYGYDSAGRVATVTDSRTSGTTTMTYTVADQVATLTTPAPGPGQAAQVVTHAYDNQGRQTSSVLPDGSTIQRDFLPTGLVQDTHGPLTFPVLYDYDAQGRLRHMTTWQNYTNATGAAVTEWIYGDPAHRGLLSQKKYADGTGVNYTYTAGGRLATRVWARNLTTSYTYNDAGDLATTSYSDGGATPSATYSYDRKGQLATVARGAVTTTFGYNDAGELLSESYVGGTLNGFSVANGYDSLLRRNSLTLKNGAGTTLAASAYSYDPASRLATVSSGNETATYSYFPNSSLVNQITLQESGTLRLTRSHTYDSLNRLSGVVSTPASGPVVSDNYQYNQLNERTSATLADGSHWDYQYDSKGEVTSGRKVWSDGTPVAGEQFQYAFDDIGNRTSSLAGGDQTGGNLRSATYAVNSLNEYTSRTVPGAVDLLGSAATNATVTVNNQPTTRHGTFYRAQLAVTNNSTSVRLSATNLAVLNRPGTTDLLGTKTGTVFVPKTPELFTHDLDGNLLQDGRWQYTWDGENRLVALQARGANEGAQTLNFEYDYAGRRVRKTVWTTNGTGVSLTADTKFLYDGWNLIAELNATDNSVARSFVWGSDLSGSIQGAGGVGGLLAARPGGGTAPQFACYDGNGNITAFVDATTGQVASQFEYGPFGEPLRIDTTSLRFGFSTKYADPETGWLYYGYRYYSPGTGRWTGRDPIEESGGLNLYGFAYNNPLCFSDYLGREGYWSDVGTTLQGMGQGAWNVGGGILSFGRDMGLGLVTLPVLVMPDTWVPKCVCDGLSSHKGNPLTQLAGTDYGAIKVFGTVMASPALAVYSVGDNAASAVGNAWNGNLQAAGQNFGEGLTTAGLLATPFARPNPLVGGYQGVGNWQQTIYNLNQAIPKSIRPKLPISINNPGGLYYQRWATKVLQEQFGAWEVAKDVTVQPFNRSGGFGKSFEFDAVCRRSKGSYAFYEFKGSPSATLSRPNQMRGHPLFQEFGGQIAGEEAVKIDLGPGQIIPPTAPLVFYNQFGVGQFFVPLTTGSIADYH